MLNKLIKTICCLLLAGALLGACSRGAEESDISAKNFTLEVVFEDGSTLSYKLSSEKTMLGDALLEEGLISGEEGAYGLYVTEVAGEYHKWEEDGKYWALYVDGEMALSGVDSTKIEDGAAYMLKAE